MLEWAFLSLATSTAIPLWPSPRTAFFCSGPAFPCCPEALKLGVGGIIAMVTTQVSHLPLVIWSLCMQINHHFCWVNLHITPDWVASVVEVWPMYMFVHY